MSPQDTPRGSTTLLHGLDAYVTEPADGRPIEGVVVIISDVFGWEFVNTRLLADRYADKGGYRVFVPDFLDGRPCPTWLIQSLRGLLSPGNILYRVYCAFWVAFAIIPFLVYQDVVRGGLYSTVATFFCAVRGGPEARRGLPVFAAGFSVGGRLAVRLAGGREGACGNPLIDAAFVGHPSNLAIPGEIERVVAPVSFALAGNDHRLDEDKVAQLQAAMEGKKGEVKVYKDAGHAFCVRADFTGKDTSGEADEAEVQAIRWFKKHGRA